ncbi:hypothetical protein EOL70_04670 [Leucothrix sargassi]|nr:hypothetical protein EOL70_04670 [Leucothrix sargassi]
MIKIIGKTWSGDFLPDVHIKACGQVSVYPWYLQLKNNVLMVEIAEDLSLDPSDLPLVGFGSGGWLYECKVPELPVTEEEAIRYIDEKVTMVFALFRDKQLKYFDAASCPCSDLGK